MKISPLRHKLRHWCKLKWLQIEPKNCAYAKAELIHLMNIEREEIDKKLEEVERPGVSTSESEQTHDEHGWINTQIKKRFSGQIHARIPICLQLHCRGLSSTYCYNVMEICRVCFVTVSTSILDPDFDWHHSHLCEVHCWAWKTSVAPPWVLVTTDCFWQLCVLSIPLHVTFGAVNGSKSCAPAGKC